MIGKKIIITGCNGQDGSYMAEYLLSLGHLVIGTVRRTSQSMLTNLSNSNKHRNFKLVELDLNDVHSITMLIKNEQPDYFINFGACSFVPDSWNMPALAMQTNAVSLIHILEAVRNCSPHCRVYSAGSSEQFEEGIQNEKSAIHPRSIYAVSKLTAQMICGVYRENYGIYAVHGVCMNHESERRQDYYVTRKITQGVAKIYSDLQKGQPIQPLELGNLDIKRDWSHAIDIVKGIWLMLNQPFPVQQIREYVLSSDETHTVREFVEKSFEVLCIDGTWIGNEKNEVFVRMLQYPNGKVGGGCLVKINSKFYRIADVNHRQGDSSLIRKEMLWKPEISFDTLIEKMVMNDVELIKNH